MAIVRFLYKLTRWKNDFWASWQADIMVLSLVKLALNCLSGSWLWFLWWGVVSVMLERSQVHTWVSTGLCNYSRSWRRVQQGLQRLSVDSMVSKASHVKLGKLSWAVQCTIIDLVCTNRAVWSMLFEQNKELFSEFIQRNITVNFSNPGHLSKIIDVTDRNKWYMTKCRFRMLRGSSESGRSARRPPRCGPACRAGSSWPGS